jgi:hypothetical protein
MNLYQVFVPPLSVPNKHSIYIYVYYFWIIVPIVYYFELLYQMSLYWVSHWYNIFMIVPSVYVYQVLPVNTWYNIFIIVQSVFFTECRHSVEMAVTIRSDWRRIFVPSVILYQVFWKHSIQYKVCKCYASTERKVTLCRETFYRVSHSVQSVPSVF